MLPAPRPLRIAAIAAAAAAGLLALGSLPWRAAPPAGPPRVDASARGAGPLSAGAAAVPVRLPPGTPIGGFARLSYRSDGVRDPIVARAAVLSEPGCTVALASIETLLVPASLERAVRARLADLPLDGLLLAATHTHAGPGGYWEAWVGERLATGPFDPAVRDAIADAIAAAIRRAWTARAPAVVSVARGRDDALARNRDGGPVDGRLLAVRVARPDGAPVAELDDFAAHATMLGQRNRLVSGDWPGALMRAAPPPAVRLFFQGAVGDQSIRIPGDAAGGLADYARAVGAALAALPPGPTSAEPALGFGAASVAVPPVAPGAVPALLRPLVRNVLGGALPSRAPVVAVRIGDALLVGVPGEPVAAVGARWREAAGPGAEVVSVAGDYLGYVDTAAGFRAGTGEAARSYYGPGLADRLGEAVVAAARAADGR